MICLNEEYIKAMFLILKEASCQMRRRFRNLIMLLPKWQVFATRPPRTSIADHMGSYWNQEDPLDHIREPSQKK